MGQYVTDWKTNAMNEENMTPSQIDEELITVDRDLKIEKFANTLEWYRAVIKSKSYQLEDDNLLGKGGFGIVYKIKEIKTNQIRALKVIDINTDNKYRIIEFKNQIFSLRKNRHRNVIELVDYFMVPQKTFFLVLELATGGHLRERLNSIHNSTGQALPEEVAKQYFIEMTNALKYVHSNGIFNGDFKLDNVLITTDSTGKDVLKVTDFGSARVAYKEGTGVI